MTRYHRVASLWWSDYGCVEKMPHSAALPFVVRRSSGVFRPDEITSTAEVVHGMLVLEGDRVVIQWRVARKISRVGPEIRTDEESDPVREVVVPIKELASARLRSTWWRLFRRERRLVLSAADLRTFEVVGGAGGLPLEHPGELVVGIRLRDRTLAREFASELDLALAEQALRRAEGADGYLDGGTPQRTLRRAADSGGEPRGA